MPPSPLIRLLLLLGFAAGLPWLDLPGLFVCLLGIGLLYLLLRGVSLRSWGRAIYRMRWFFLTLIVIYAFFTPGTLIFGISWLPSREGLTLAFARSLVLALMLGAVYLLLGTTNRDSLAAALTRVLRFLFPAALARRLARRLLASLEAVPAMQQAVAASRQSGRGGLLDRAAALIAGIERDALADDGANPPVLPDLAHPRWFEWLWPAALSLVMLGLAHLNFGTS